LEKLGLFSSNRKLPNTHSSALNMTELDQPHIDNPYLVYPDQIVPLFFTSAPCSQQDCHAFLRKVFSESLHKRRGEVVLEPLPGELQGCCSYTVLVNAEVDGVPQKLVAQFRKLDSILNPHIIDMALQTYTDRFVPICTIYDDCPLQLTTAPYAGECFAIQEFNFGIEERRTALADLADFLSIAYEHPHASKGEEEAIIGKLLQYSNWRLTPGIKSKVEGLLKSAGKYHLHSIIDLPQNS
jgi:hypothetical protein